MGYMCHHAVIVSSCDKKLIEKARQKAVEIFGRYPDTKPLVSNMVTANVNNYRAFFIAPDGSKEGWSASDEGNECRKDFLDWVKAQAFEDGSNMLGWALVQFDDDEEDNKLLEASK